MATLDYLRRARLSVEANGENVRWRPSSTSARPEAANGQVVLHVAGIV